MNFLLSFLLLIIPPTPTPVNMVIPSTRNLQLPQLQKYLEDVNTNYVAIDRAGRIYFDCAKCPDKFCRQLACEFKTVTAGVMTAHCECEIKEWYSK